jgi:hypothetical protein
MLHRLLACALISFGGGTVSAAPTEEIAGAERWVGFCVRYSTSDKKLSDAVLVLTSGDAALDERMRRQIAGMVAFHHIPLGEWVPLRVSPNDGQQKDAEPYNGPELPEIDCSGLEEPTTPER